MVYRTAQRPSSNVLEITYDSRRLLLVMGVVATLGALSSLLLSFRGISLSCQRAGAIATCELRERHVLNDRTLDFRVERVDLEVTSRSGDHGSIWLVKVIDPIMAGPGPEFETGGSEDKARQLVAGYRAFRNNVSMPKFEIAYDNRKMVYFGMMAVPVAFAIAFILIVSRSVRTRVILDDESGTVRIRRKQGRRETETCHSLADFKKAKVEREEGKRIHYVLYFIFNRGKERIAAFGSNKNKAEREASKINALLERVNQKGRASASG